MHSATCSLQCALNLPQIAMNGRSLQPFYGMRAPVPQSMQFLTCRRPPMQMLFLLSFQRCVFVRTPIYPFVNFHGNGPDAQTGDKILTAIGSRDRMLAHFHLVFPPHKSVAHKGNWTSFKSTARMLTFALPWACVLSYCSQRRRGPLSAVSLSIAAYSTCEKP